MTGRVGDSRNPKLLDVGRPYCQTSLVRIRATQVPNFLDKEGLIARGVPLFEPHLQHWDWSCIMWCTRIHVVLSPPSLYISYMQSTAHHSHPDHPIAG
jgi:hypothetical protein